MSHHAIVVSGSYGEYVEEAHAEATTLFHGTEVEVTAVTATVVNGRRSFLVAPDGSKEGWAESDEGDAARREFVSYLDGQQYEDGSNPLNWVLVQFGDDGHDTRVLRANDDVHAYIRAWDTAGR